MNTDVGVPRLPLTTISAIAARSYGIVATAHALPSDHDQNALLITEQGLAMVMKIANSRESAAVIDAECRVMHHLADTALCPRVIKTVDGAEITREGGHLIRMITVVDGVPMGRVTWHSDALRRDVGATLARLDRALQELNVPAVARVTDWDLAEAERVVLRDRDRVVDARVREAIDITLGRYREQTAPQLHAFRRSVIHGDANDYNILVHAREQRVSGVIDFGDMVVSHTVNDLAIAMAYVALSADDPLAAAAMVAAGYHAAHPLPEHEGRRTVQPDVYATRRERLHGRETNGGAPRRGLPQHQSAADCHRTAGVGCDPSAVRTLRIARCLWFCTGATQPAVVAWLAAHHDQCAPLLGYAFTTTNTAPLDFSAEARSSHATRQTTRRRVWMHVCGRSLPSMEPRSAWVAIASLG